MDTGMKEALKEICRQIYFDEPLSQHTTIRVGGAADVLLYPQTIEELTHIVLLARKNKTPLFVLGAGSNLLVRDKGIRGLVVSLSRGFSTIRLEREEGDQALLYSEAGVGVPRLVDFCAERGFSGVEALAGIPGNMGGVLFMNAGTPDGEIADVVTHVTFLDREGKLVTWSREEVKFSYRASHFPRGAILLSARLSLTHQEVSQIQEKVRSYRQRRVDSQPLQIPNLGSIFKNPKKEKGKGLHAGKLVEEAGLKNIRVGGARISPKHGNFIVNEGGATAKDILALMGLMRDKVKEKFGVTLEAEVKVVGEE